jgi:lipoate---protein ligase
MKARGLQIYLSKTNNIFSNLAFEEFLIEKASPYPTLFLWRNQPTVTIGRHQNPWKECNLSVMESLGISLARRYSGGGAVFQDLGCTTFSFLNRIGNGESRETLIDSNFETICSAVSNLGVQASRQGRNDVVAGGRKISGSAFKVSPESLLHHGTILVSTDMCALGRLLTPDKLKLQSKGISSVNARVANLTDLAPEASHDLVCELIQNEFKARYSGAEIDVDVLEHGSKVLQTPEYLAHFEKLKDWNWRFGSTPEFSHSFSHRIDGLGCFELHLNISGATITNCKMFSDCLDTTLVSKTTSALMGCTYDTSTVFAALNGNPLCEWVASELAKS